MAAALVRIMNGADSKESASTAPIITRDLLGGCCSTLDSDEQNHIDFKSGKVDVERCNSSSSSSSNSGKKDKTLQNFQDLNFPPSSKQTFDDPTLDLKLFPSSYQSVCTLDKVKSALERAEKETLKKRTISMCRSSLSPPSNSPCSIKDNDELDEEKKPLGSFAAGCPCCFLYVLISKNDPKCPRCKSDVPLPVAAKRPRIDLNMSI